MEHSIHSSHPTGHPNSRDSRASSANSGFNVKEPPLSERAPRGHSAQEVQVCIAACFECAKTCKSCADACLSEDMKQEMVRSIRLTLQCVEACTSTANMLLLQSQTDESARDSQIHSCFMACERCAAECTTHARTMEHCRICAESCRNCARTCRVLLSG
jgi:hypothetical protein